MPTGLQKIYAGIPSRYEFINHVLTFGLDTVVRRQAAGMAARKEGRHWLDVCSGTGEMAQYLLRLNRNGCEIIGADFSLPMVKAARNKGELKNIPYVIATAEELPFDDESFDLVTISFATRNLNTSPAMLKRRFAEFHRILKPNGRFINLETSQPSNRLIRSLMHAYVNLTVKPVGSIISGNKAGYAYLANSIPRFYSADRLAEVLSQSGFKEVTYKHQFFGITAVHEAVK
jgi:demethylmenaquinone methyltransferase/2-methoxy-6-polyprenyl-1,4-benzoquinol methylase